MKLINTLCEMRVCRTWQVDAAEKVLSAYYAKKEAKVRCQAIPTVT